MSEDDMTHDEAIDYAKSIEDDRKLIKAIRYPFETMTVPEVRAALRMAADDLLEGTLTMVDFTGIWRRCRAKVKAITAAAIVVVATIMMMTPTTQASDIVGRRLQAEILRKLDELDASRGVLCFELGDFSSKSYQAAKCFAIEGEGLPFKCTFDNGDPEAGCSMHSDGCLVCEGMD